MTDGLISEAVIDAARERLFAKPYTQAIREFSKAEPDLYYAIGQFAVNATGEVEDVPEAAQDASYRAVWQAVLIALESYRLAHFRLWRETELGNLLLRLDPTLAEPGPGIIRPEPDETVGPGDGSEVTT